MKRNRSAGAWKSLVMIGSIGMAKVFLYTSPRRIYSIALPASWVGLFGAQQYSAAKHGVLGLMRALDSIAASEDIRTACIHPWFTGKPSPSPHSLFYFTVVAQTPASSTGS
jgi:NAD(P)-dependent dehydrogenase (short-subunit alcohol dehydrogenase family)